MHLIMAFSCLLAFTLSVAAIRRYFLGRRHLRSEFQGPHRKGDGPVSLSEKQIAVDFAANDAVAVTEVFAVANSALSVASSDVDVKVRNDVQRSDSNDHEHVIAIKRFSAMKSASDEEVARLAQHVRTVCVAAGETIIAAGAVASTAYVIKSGSVSLLPGSDAEGDETRMRQLYCGDYFGEQALETTETYRRTAIAISACQLWILERSKLALALSSTQELSKRTVFNNVSLKSAATAALTTSHLSLKHGSSRAEPVELHGVSQAAPSLVPQQQAPSALVSSYAIPRPQPSDSHPSISSYTGVLQASSQTDVQEAAASAFGSGAAVARVPKSLLKKHAMLFDSESNEL